MSAADNKALVRRILEAYAQSDLGPFLDAIDPGIVWTSAAPETHYGFGGRHIGRAGALASVAKIATEYQLNHYEVAELVAEDEIVWMTANVDFTHRRTGQRQRFPLVSRWQIRAGKILSLTEYFDSASMLIREGRLVPAA